MAATPSDSTVPVPTTSVRVQSVNVTVTVYRPGRIGLTTTVCVKVTNIAMQPQLSGAPSCLNAKRISDPTTVT